MEKDLNEKNSGFGPGAGTRNALAGSGLISAHKNYLKLLNIYILTTHTESKTKTAFYLSRENLGGEKEVESAIARERENRNCQSKLSPSKMNEEIKMCPKLFFINPNSKENRKCQRELNQSKDVIFEICPKLFFCKFTSKTKPNIKTLFLLSENCIEMANRTATTATTQDQELHALNKTILEDSDMETEAIEETSLKLSLSSISDYSEKMEVATPEQAGGRVQACLPNRTKESSTPKSTKGAQPTLKTGKRTPPKSKDKSKDKSRDKKALKPYQKPENWIVLAASKDKSKEQSKQKPTEIKEKLAASKDKSKEQSKQKPAETTGKPSEKPAPTKGEPEKNLKKDGGQSASGTWPQAGPKEAGQVGTGAGSGTGAGDAKLPPPPSRKRPLKPSYAKVCQQLQVCIIREKGGRSLEGTDLIEFQRWLMLAAYSLGKAEIELLRVKQGGIRDGGIWVGLDTPQSVQLLKGQIHLLEPIKKGDAGYVCYGPGEAPFESFWVETSDPYAVDDNKGFFETMVSAANPELFQGGAEGELRVLEKRKLLSRVGTLLKVAVDKGLLENLKKLDHKLIYGIGYVTFLNSHKDLIRPSRPFEPSASQAKRVNRAQDTGEAMDTDGQTEVMCLEDDDVGLAGTPSGSQTQ